MNIMEFSSTAVDLLLLMLLASGIIFPRHQESVSIYALYVCIMERVFMLEFCNPFWHFSRQQRYPEALEGRIKHRKHRMGNKDDEMELHGCIMYWYKIKPRVT